MRIDAGRGKLYATLKETRIRWQKTTDVWDDEARRDFEEHVWQPLDDMAAEALRAMDQLSQLFHQIRQECERDQLS